MALDSSAISSTTLSELTTATNAQGTDEVASIKPALSQQQRKRKAPSSGINWQRLKGYRLPTDDKKKTSWIWKHGWRLMSDDEHEYWLCKECHQHWYLKGCFYRSEKSTSSALDHMRIRHKLTEEGPIIESLSKNGKPRSLEYYGYDAASALNNQNALSFQSSTFQALLFNWIITDNVSFRKLESDRFHALLQYLNPRCERFLPSHQTIRRTIGEIFDKHLGAVTENLRAAVTKVSFSFDLWTSKNRLALLGLVAHFIDVKGTPKSVLLALPRQHGRHTGSNIAETIAAVICHYDLQGKIGYFVSDNAKNNPKALSYLAAEFGFNAHHCWLRCIGHIFNLCGQAVLFGNDSDAFEREVGSFRIEEQQLLAWRKRGPIGRLHNVLVYLDASPQRWETLVSLQRELIAPTRPEGKKEVYQIVHDVVTRWNSFDDSAERALYLRPAIDEFIQQEQDAWNSYVRRTSELGRKIAKSEPSIVRDKLSSDDWAIIAQYHDILRPLKDATLLLQGTAGGEFGAIWQVLPTVEKLLSHFEGLRIQFPIAESQPAVDSSMLSAQHHFTASINLGWQKLNDYYTKMEETPVYVAAVVLHPRMKWRYLERRWSNEAWLIQARKSFNNLWLEYASRSKPLLRHHSRDRSTPSPKRQSLATMMLSDDDSSSDEGVGDIDQLAQYLAEQRHPSLKIEDSPVGYWTLNKKRWPDLASMALDIFAVPAMSDAPERIFSTTGDVLSPRRRLLQSETVGWLMTLKSWINSGLITLDEGTFDRLSEAVIVATEELETGAGSALSS